jgi:hypothetical protein
MFGVLTAAETGSKVKRDRLKVLTCRGPCGFVWPLREPAEPAGVDDQTDRAPGGEDGEVANGLVLQPHFVMEPGEVG